MDKIKKRARLLHVYLSQLDDSIHERQDNIESFYKKFDDTYGTRHNYSPESYMAVSAQTHQVYTRMISYFSKQSDIIMKFDPEFGAYIKEHIESLRVITSDVFDMIKCTPTPENQEESFPTETQTADFGTLMFEMQHTSLAIESTINATANGVASALNFLEEK